MDFTKSDVAEGAGISRASLFNYWNQLELHGIVKITRQFGKTKLYTLNSKSMIAKRILELEMSEFSIQSLTGGRKPTFSYVKNSEHAQKPPDAIERSNMPPICDGWFLTNL